MANRVLSITAKIRDAVSQPLSQIQNSLKKTGAAANQTSVNFTEFNRVMFTTGAFIGFFTRSFSKFSDSLLQGAQLDRLQTQFERIMGPKGDLFKAISGFTDNSIDKIEALRSAIAMKTLGIAGNTAQTAELIARAGTAAKMAGIDSGEGIKKFTQFLKDGSVANLEFLNLIRSNDPALKLQMSMISKYGGVLGGALTAQMKYNMGLRLLRSATQGALKGQRDLYDVVFDVRQSFSLLKSEVGIFLGTAISSILDKITKAVDKFSAWLENIRYTKKEILFLAKAFVVATSALAGFLATIGTLRLLAIGLRAVGISTIPIILGFTTLVSLFTAITAKVREGTTPVERFTEKLRVFAAVLKGVFQLVSSYLTDQNNFSKGIGKMDRELFELLNNNGLFKFVHKVAQVTAVISKFVIETFKQLRDWAIALDEQLGSLGNKFLSFFGANQKIDVNLEATGGVVDEPKIKRISDIWVNANQTVYKLLVKGAAALALAVAGGKLLGIGKGFLSKIPIVGKFFSKGPGQQKEINKDADRPKGTKNDPIYVLEAVGFGKEKFGPFPIPIPKSLPAPDKGVFGTIKNILKNFTVFRSLYAVVRRVITSFEGLSKISAAIRFFRILFLVEAAAGTLHGVIKGLINNFSSFTGLFGTAYDYLKSVDYSQLFSDLYNSISSTFEGIIGFVGDVAGQIYDKISEGISPALEVFKDIGGFIYQKLQEGFGIISPYIKNILDPLGESFNTLKGWVTDIIKALSEWYTKLKSIPILGNIVKAAEDVTTSPVQTFSKIGETGVGAAAATVDMLSDSIKNATAKNLLEQGRQGKETPFIPVTQEDRYDYAMRAIEQAQGSEQQRMASALREAQSGTSAGGKEITREEWAAIFGFAIDKSVVAKNTGATHKEIKESNQKKTVNSRRGGCQ